VALMVNISEVSKFLFLLVVVVDVRSRLIVVGDAS